MHELEGELELQRTIRAQRAAQREAQRARRHLRPNSRGVFFQLMNIRFWQKKRLDPLPDEEEREAHKFEREYDEEQSSINAVVKKMGRENLDAPFKQD